MASCVHLGGGKKIGMGCGRCEEARAVTEIVHCVPVTRPKIPSDRWWVVDVGWDQSGDVCVESGAALMVLP